jgi:hypothetical protein
MILSQKQLGQALHSTILVVKILDSEGKYLQAVSPAQAVTMLSRGRYQVGGSPNRVKYLRELAPAGPPRLFPIDTHYQDGRACMKFWADQRSPGGHQVAA